MLNFVIFFGFHPKRICSVPSRYKLADLSQLSNCHITTKFCVYKLMM